MSQFCFKRVDKQLPTLSGSALARRCRGCSMIAVPFRQLLVSVLFLLPAAGMHAAPSGWAPLLEPAVLAAMMERQEPVRILQVTGDYRAGHIEGAVEAPYERFRGPADNPGQLPAMAQLAALVRELGVSARTPVVVVHQGSNPADMGAATRVYWTLKSLGVQDLAVLNGGFNAWVSQGFVVSTQPVTAEPSRFEPQWNDQWTVTTAQLEEAVARGEATLVDARQPAFYRGEQASSGRPGTIRGASNLSFQDWFEDGRMMQPDSAITRLEQITSPAAPMTVSFCNTGHLASINWFMMSEVQGLPNVRLYPESITEWSMENRPMDNEPSRIRHYWQMTADWLRGLAGA